MSNELTPIEQKHYENLKRWHTTPARELVGFKWQINIDIYHEFLELLPPIRWVGNSFCMSEMITGSITTKYSQEGEHYFCEYVDLRPSNKPLNGYTLAQVKAWSMDEALRLITERQIGDLTFDLFMYHWKNGRPENLEHGHYDFYRVEPSEYDSNRDRPHYVRR